MSLTTYMLRIVGFARSAQLPLLGHALVLLLRLLILIALIVVAVV